MQATRKLQLILEQQEFKLCGFTDFFFSKCIFILPIFKLLTVGKSLCFIRDHSMWVCVLIQSQLFQLPALG